MRKSFDELCGLVSGRLGKDPRSSDIFIFLNKKRTLAKLFRWEPGVFVLFYKRLEKSTLGIPMSKDTEPAQPLEYGQQAIMITGFSLKRAYQILLLNTNILKRVLSNTIIINNNNEIKYAKKEGVFSNNFLLINVYLLIFRLLIGTFASCLQVKP